MATPRSSRAMSPGDHFLPTNLEEADRLGWNECDVILVSADAYVDHPSFGPALIGRFLESLGLRVGIIPQPDWHDGKDFAALGRPRLFFGVTAGNLDSMVNLYTAQRKIRSEDAYSEGGKPGQRPYLPSLVYTNRLKQLYKDVPVVLGGLEASLRRIAHYDYYQDKLRPSILLDAKADLLVYGNGEAPLREIVTRLKQGQTIREMWNIRGTVVPVNLKQKSQIPATAQALPGYEEILQDKNAFNTMTRMVLDHLNPYLAGPLYQDYGSRGILINPPALPLTTEELDAIYELPFMRKEHPRYEKSVPALTVVAYSLTSHRGCYGGCNFCALALHQGKFIQCRSRNSLLQEAERLAGKAGKPVVLSDVGGPTANMYGTHGKDMNLCRQCRRVSCLYPAICHNLETSGTQYLEMLAALRQHPQVKNVYINTGIRYDLALRQKDFIEALVRYHTQGQLSVAPEHCSDEVLRLMGKPRIASYAEFAAAFYRLSQNYHRKLYLLPYFIVGHPGSSEGSECALARYVQEHDIKVEQIQEFYPTPMSMSTAMYFTGRHPVTGETVVIEKHTRVKKDWKKRIVTSD